MLVTLKEYKQMTPFEQGYAVYMQAAYHGSELKDERNPYTTGTASWRSWNLGNERAMIAAQDCEE